MTMEEWGLGPVFRPADVPPRERGDFDPLPAGWRRMMVTKTERKATKANDGEYLVIELTVPDGDEFGGRKVWDRLNLVNRNPEAVSIAKRAFADLVQAAGLVQINHPDQLIGKLIEVKLKLKPASGEWEASNECRGYRSPDGAVPAQASTPLTVVKPSNPSTPAWAQKKPQ